ncbi:MAG: zf-HC2 domain-containing protein, partial [Chloroflexi bacterium]|nr:zf-HC2 domain-containing protein [Chloroflexota bacterium]
MSRKQEGRRSDGQRPFIHRRIEQLLSNYRYLTPDEQTQIQEHLATCHDCRRQMTAFQQMDQRLQQGGWQFPQRRLKEGFYAAMAAEWEKRPSLWNGKWSYVGGLAGQVVGLTLLAAMVAAMWFLMRQQMAGPIAAPSATPLPNATPMRLRTTLT